MGRDSLALIVGAYGAVVATVTAVYQLVRERPGAKVVLMPITSVTDDNPEPVDLWGIRVVNHRKRPITIQSAGLLRKSGVHVHGLPLNLFGQRIEEPFPVTLGDGEVLELCIARTPSFDDVRGAWARDALNRPYECRYPSRSPQSRWRAWRQRRAIDQLIREREERTARDP